MATPVEALSLRRGLRRLPSTPSTTPNTAIRSSFLDQVFLHDWWIIKVDLDESHGKRLGVGGFTWKEDQGVRSFSSAPIVKRLDAVTFKTVDGTTIMVSGYLNRTRSLENGFSHEICDDFLIGFPYCWEEFAVLSVGEEPANGAAYKTPSPCGDSRSNLSSDAKLQKHYNDDDGSGGLSSSAKRESCMPIHNMVSMKEAKAKQKKRGSIDDVEHVKRSGPLTRSRARLGRGRDQCIL